MPLFFFHNFQNSIKMPWLPFPVIYLYLSFHPNPMPYFHLLFPTSCLLPLALQCQAPNPTLISLSLQFSTPSLPPIPSHPITLPLGSTRLPFPQDSTPLSLPRPVPPGAAYPKFSPHFRPLAPPSPPEEGGGRRERRGAALRKVKTISH